MSRLTRRHFLAGSLAAGTAATVSSRALALDVNAEITLGFISCGGRATGLMGAFSKIEGVRIAGLCDPDRNRLEAAKKRFPKAETHTHPRDLINSKNIDAVVIATCNHWHCLAAIWAMEAGKDVYVEKPLSHSQWEGRQTVAAAAKYGRVCQIGTQQRSDPMQAEIKQFLHQQKALGDIVSARVNRYGVRQPIGKRATPLQIPSNVAYDVWLGPAQEEKLYRDKLHYDWHWDWNTGSGEMGNWGVHVLDDLRNNVFQDSVALPKRIFGGGGRVAWNDAGETPNVQFVYFDTGRIPVVIGLTNLTAGRGSKKGAPHPGPGSGYIAYCEGGRLEGQRGRAAAFDAQGKKIKEFRGNSGNGLHQKNFIEAVRRGDPSLLNADVEMGHFSTGWCNLANIAFQCGQPFSRADAQDLKDESGQWKQLLGEMEQLLKAHELDLEDASVRLSPELTFDVQTEQFVGGEAEAANDLLSREYRKGYEVPRLA